MNNQIFLKWNKEDWHTVTAEQNFWRFSNCYLRTKGNTKRAVFIEQWQRWINLNQQDRRYSRTKSIKNLIWSWFLLVTCNLHASLKLRDDIYAVDLRFHFLLSTAFLARQWAKDWYQKRHSAQTFWKRLELRNCQKSSFDIDRLQIETVFNIFSPKIIVLKAKTWTSMKQEP